MKIYYSPFYSGNTYIDYESRQIMMDEKTVGNMGLLCELELRAGLPQTSVDENVRLANYRDCLAKCVKGTQFESSARIDLTGVAMRLLEWRDQLVMSGWNGQEIDGSEKLGVLSKVEKEFRQGEYMGDADRWVRLLAESGRLKGESFLAEEDEIVLMCPVALVPTIIIKVIGNQGKLKTPVFTDGDVLEAKDYEVISVKDVTDAYSWLADKDVESKTVVINHDNKRLDDILTAQGRPRVDAKTEAGNPVVSQIYKLGMSLFCGKLNLQNLLTYLQMTESPLPAKLRKELASSLSYHGGIYDEFSDDDDEKVLVGGWHFIINKFIEEDDKFLDKRARKERLKFIGMVDREYTDMVPVADVKDYLGRLSKWAKMRAEQLTMNNEQLTIGSDQLRHQLMTVADFCTSTLCYLPSELKAESGKQKVEISAQELQSIIEHVYASTAVRISEQQVGAWNVVRGVEDMLDVPENLIWLDCWGGGQNFYPYSFLSKSEIAKINEIEGVNIVSEGEVLEEGHKLMIHSMNKIPGKVTFVCAQMDNNTPLGEHPVITELNYLKGEAEVKAHTVSNPAIGVKENGVNDVITFEKKVAYQLDENLMKNLRQVNAGYSMFGKLFQTPFDFLLEYEGGMKEPSDDVLADISLVKGNVAHLFIETLVGDCGKSVKTMRVLFEKEFDVRFKNAIMQKGLQLELPENHTECVLFEKNLKESVGNLIGIIEDLGLTPLECEHEIRLDEFEGFSPCIAKIDMILMDERGSYVIFDFKWSKSKSYKESLKNNESFQLEWYRKMLEAEKGKGMVRGMGYYLMIEGKLFTTDFEGENIVRVSASNNSIGDLWATMKNSYDYRMDEISRGYIEEGEGIDFDEINYYNDMDEKELFPLKNDKYGTKNEKAKGGGYSSNKTLGNHGILKNHVK